jgi:hypothetical protein
VSEKYKLACTVVAQFVLSEVHFPTDFFGSSSKVTIWYAVIKIVVNGVLKGKL